jgi:ankyrin repeat protein
MELSQYDEGQSRRLTKDFFGRTALHYVGMRAKVWEGFDVGTNGFDRLLERQGDRDSADSYGMTALHAAAETGNTKLIELLVRGGADKENKFRNRTALHIAAESGSVEAVQQLIILGADISAKTLGGKNPLHLAVLEDRSGVVRELLKTEGADAGTTLGSGHCTWQLRPGTGRW